ncbi:MAG: threonine/serine exporter family protein [Clostridia bacterium]|nr:threonine/serine exporter family protein [Clostridia bacterium]
MVEILRQIGHGLIIFLSSAVGTYGFAIFMHAPKKAWLPASLIGGVSYALYWALLQFSVYEPLSVFLGALLGSVLGQFYARRMRMIASIFILLAMIPMVPGLGLYRCMSFLAQGLYTEGAKAGVGAMVDIVMIAFGLGVGSYGIRMFRRPSAAAKEVR